MKLIIDINEENYKRIKDDVYDTHDIHRAIISVGKGIPLKDEIMLATLMSLVTDKDYKPKLEGEKE